MKNKYNPKIDVKFLTHLSDDFNHFESELRIKRIYKNHLEPKSFYEKEFCQFKNAAEIIKSSPSFDAKTAVEIIKMFDTCVDIELDHLSNFINCLNENNDNDSLQIKTELFILSMKLLEHSDRQMSISFLFVKISDLPPRSTRHIHVYENIFPSKNKLFQKYQESYLYRIHNLR